MSASAPVALVTGGARRVGRAIVLALADAGFDVVIHYHTSEADARATEQLVRERGRQALPISTDLASSKVQQLIDRAVSAFDRLDVLVNNASIFEPDPREPIDPAQRTQHWNHMFAVNAIAPAMLIESAEPYLADKGNGCVVNLCDISSSTPWRKYQAYCASKAALVNLTKSYAKRLAPKVRVNGVSPGIAVFPEDYDQAIRDRLVAKVPLRREGTPEEIAAVVRFLVTEGSYITGQIINVDGGRSIV